MGKNQNSVVVLQIRLKFWWMIPMGVRDNHTKYEQETQRWRFSTVHVLCAPFANFVQTHHQTVPRIFFYLF